MTKLALVVLCVLLMTAVESANRVRMYDFPYLQNLIYDKDVSYQCVNIPQINDRASSVSTNAPCVYLYEDRDCTGRRIRLEPDSPGQDNLADLDFDNVVSSIRACCPPIPGRHDCCSWCPVPYGNKTWPFFLQTAKLRIYEKYDYKDLIYEGVPTEECLDLPYINDRASSVETLGTCVELYDGWNCMGRHITVRPGCPSGKNLGRLRFDNMVSSIRACCKQRDWDSSDSC